ncbi:MAG: translation initiation factor IF-2 N-terminal domain-containing protein, partial [Acidobacteria bacterium]|nr:translation initiation factor IF-2 N-terminal domain-containing protein [Acidobacteriota bacterium]
MEKVRINDLARELEVKSKEVLDFLPEIGVSEKKTHSSSIEPEEAEKVRQHFRGQADAAREAASRAAKAAARPLPGEIKTKIDLTGISKPGDVLKAITRQTVHAEAASAPAAAKAGVK